MRHPLRKVSPARREPGGEQADLPRPRKHLPAYYNTQPTRDPPKHNALVTTITQKQNIGLTAAFCLFALRDPASASGGPAAFRFVALSAIVMAAVVVRVVWSHAPMDVCSISRE